MADASASSELRRRLDERRATPQWAVYEEVREHVLAMKDLERSRLDGVGTPSAYWREELAGFDYLLDASPLMIDKLRHQSYHITGIKDYDYRGHHQLRGKQLAAKLQALLKLGGRDLLVPESRALGGYGFEIEGQLYNIDTLKFYEVLIAMQRGGVLSPLRTTGERKVVAEIGSGWGGFAYQFKTVCPNTTYVLVDFPELFLISATYLKTLFPDATFHFYDDVDVHPPSLLEADFVFLPHTALRDLRPPRLDLVINMVSFQEMTAGQVSEYVAWAADLGAPYLYSLNRAKSPYNDELEAVVDHIAERYRPHEIPVLPVSYTQMLPGKVPPPFVRQKLKRPRGTPYQHIIGWRREDR
jgi:putative sugar O-methyltransferase